MWLLSTDRAELHHFLSPEAVTGGYAILSHTWGDHEQTFQETQALRKRCKKSRKSPHDLSSEKVHQCCILAERHGYRWVWDDTCCIDKMSSTELSEAINSMFVWYSCAEVCFAYLGDVENDCELDAPDSAFRTARWHSRGWTLQELIASFLVTFLSRDWKTIGTKRELAPLLEEITGVRRQVLTRETHYSAISIAERMLWASKWSTTRMEDEAYCLMGLFNVSMPTIYGEGQQAFQHLQQEIMKQSFDISLFAWGDLIDLEDATQMELRTLYELLDGYTEHDCYLLAPSPKRFRKPFGQTVRHTPSVTDPLQPYLDWQWKTNADEPEPEPVDRVQRQFGPFARIELPRFSVTHYGVECRFPIIELHGLTIAVLLCDTGHEHIGLFLLPSNDPVQDPSRKKYHVGYAFRERSSLHPEFFRLISLGNDFYNLSLWLNGNFKTVTAEWRDIFIADSSPPLTRKDVAPSRCFPLHSIEPAPPFRLPHWLIGRLNQTGMELLSLDMLSQPMAGKPLLMVAFFEDSVAAESVVIVLGTCMQSPGPPAHWANALSFCWNNWSREVNVSHDCHEHHVKAWPSWTKDFGDYERIIRLSFSCCKLTPEQILVVHVELEGRVYDAMKKRKNVEFPSREALGLGTHAVGSRMLPSPNQPTNAGNPPPASVGGTSQRLGRELLTHPARH